MIAVIFQVISVLPFSAKNAFLIAYLLQSSLARLKNVVCCFQTISCLLSFKEGNGLISSTTSPVPELSFLPAPYRGWTRAGERRVQVCLPFTKTIRLEISGINIKQLNARLRERESLWNISTPARETSKSRKIASSDITAHIFWSFPNGMAQTIWFSKWNFRFSRVNGVQDNLHAHAQNAAIFSP